MRFELKNINDQIPKDIDIYICSSSFEDRSLTILKSIEESRIRNAIICTNHDQKEIVGANTTKIKKLLSCKIEIAKFDSNNPLTIADQLRDKINILSTTKQQNVVVDITTFTHEALLILFKLIQLNEEYSKNKEIIFLYNSAQSYCYDAKGIESIWLSKGLKDKRTILGYPGKFKPYNPSHFVMLFGYEVERAKHLIDAYEPDTLSLGIADEKESVASDVHNISMNLHNNLKVVYEDVFDFSFSCINPIKTVKLLGEHVNKFPAHNVVISPMNNKISTLACGLFAMNRPEIQIISSRANIYNTNSYSKSSDYFYKFEFNALIEELSEE
jgi:hypothetical protein